MAGAGKRGGLRAWSVFSPHHYLSAKLHLASHCYLVWWSGVPVAFVATLQTISPQGPGYRKIHRVVVLPDYQGVGIGSRAINAVAAYELKMMRNKIHTFGIVTSHPALIATLNRSPRWRCMSVNKCGTNPGAKRVNTPQMMWRWRASFSYVPIQHGQPAGEQGQAPKSAAAHGSIAAEPR